MRDFQEISHMIAEAASLQEQWRVWAQDPDCKANRKDFADAIRNLNALNGVVKALRWARGDEGIEHPLE